MPANCACTASARLPACPSTPSCARVPAPPAREHYDELLRAAASLKRAWVPASLLLTRLKNSSPQTPLAAALGEYGRIVRTNFLLVYCADPQQRARITGQLNKGETLDALRRHFVIGSRAQLPADEDDHHRQALCLQLFVNAVLVWNARYTTAALEQLGATHPELVGHDSALARLAPVGHAHINPLGRYRFDNPDGPPSGQLRPLNDRDANEQHSWPTSPIGVSGDKH
jgi:hypothetical protein